MLLTGRWKYEKVTLAEMQYKNYTLICAFRKWKKPVNVYQIVIGWVFLNNKFLITITLFNLKKGQYLCSIIYLTISWAVEKLAKFQPR